jgi:Tfp pilus assembly protein PilZ
MSANSLKQHRSRMYVALTLAYLLFPITFLPVLMFLLDLPLSETARIGIHPAFLVVSFFAVITGYALHEMKRWGWYLLQFTQVLVVLLAGFLSYRYGQHHYPVIAFLVLVFVVWFAHNWISREVRVPYFMPQIPWWESNPKFKTQIPAQVIRQGGKVLEADIMDLSLAGCFIKCKPEFVENEMIEIRCQLFEREWKCRGVVVWNTYGAVTHPRGIGVKFGAMDRGARRVLKAATIRLSRISKLNRTGRYWLTTEEYNKLLAKLRAPLPRGDA